MKQKSPKRWIFYSPVRGTEGINKGLHLIKKGSDIGFNLK